jgi:hypothetical protein
MILEEDRLMKKTAVRSLRSLLTEAAPIFRLPPRVLQQLVGYYGDWRRSRDILNDADEASTSHQLPRLFMHGSSFSSTSNSYRS